jgi:rod shape determining protein RodA
VCLVIVGAPAVLILGQPDLGSVLVFAAIALGVLLVAGARPRHFAVLGVLGGLLLGAAFATGAVEGYQRDRLTSFAADGGAGDEAGYNLDQAKTAIGAGGLTGTGLFQGTQTRGRYVPEQQTDFIFTVVGEELGFLGGASLLVLFAVVCWRVWRTAWVARGTFGALLCVGVLAMLLFQVFENVGMAMGIMPITGLPLPFVSYGGSSLVATLTAIGLVLNVHRAAAR